MGWETKHFENQLISIPAIHVEKMGDAPELNFPEYKFWYEAIKKDNIASVSSHLQTNDKCLKENLLNGKFRFDKDFDKATPVETSITKSSIVWHLVVIFCSRETIKLFISKNVNLHSKNVCDYNVVHNMVLTVAFQPKYEDEMMKKYRCIMDNIKEED